MSDSKIPLSEHAPPAGQLNMAFAVTFSGKDHIQYVGPLKEEVVKKMLALLGPELFKYEVPPAPPGATAG